MSQTIMIPGGYAIVEEDVIYIPTIWCEKGLGMVLDKLVETTGIKRIIFSALLNPSSFRKHLRNIKREWREWVPEIGDWSDCIEIEYQPNTARMRGWNTTF